MLLDEKRQYYKLKGSDFIRLYIGPGYQGSVYIGCKFGGEGIMETTRARGSDYMI